MSRARWEERPTADDGVIALPATWEETDAEWRRLKNIYNSLVAEVTSAHVDGKRHRDGTPYTPIEYEAWRARAAKAQYALGRDIARLRSHRLTLPVPKAATTVRRRVKHASGWAILVLRDDLGMDDPVEVASYICTHEPQALSEDDAAFCRAVNRAIDWIQDALTEREASHA